MRGRPKETEKTISTIEAMKIANQHGKKISIPTLISWIRNNKLGHQPGGVGGRWHVFEDRFRKFITGA